jgi:ATP-dependent helicase/nuclease subunit A
MSAHDPQRAAADPSRSAWVSANAGAGKTHTLANRVTRLLLAGAKPERILCLTYTKAAAAEMAGRLFDQLGKWAMAPDGALASYIEEIGADGRTPDELRKARRLFALALETPGGLKIQTIHSFCQQLLVRFPLEAGVPPSFDVLDEQTARELIGRARTQVLERAGTGDATLASAVSYLVTQTNETRLQQILDAALGGDRRKLERVLAMLADDRTKALRRGHGLAENKSEAEIISEFCEEVKGEIEQLEAAVEWLESGTTTDRKKASALRRAMDIDLAFESFDAFREAFLTGKGEPYASLATKGLAAKRPDLLEYLESLSRRFCAAEEQRRGAHAAALCDAAVTLAQAIRERYTAEKRLRGALDYDDLINETRRLLERGDAAAWVLYKLDGGLDHILVDEAQDTSPEQWAILRKLTEEFFAGAGSRGERALERTIFAVGDEKQSIFSFQGADPVQFDINRQHFEERVKTSSHAFAYERLTTSRRSAPQILSFVDEVFRDPDARAGLTSTGAEITHTPLRETAKGRVEFWPSLKPPTEDDTDPWTRPVDTVSEASSVSRLAKQLAEKIRGWIGHVTLPGHSEAIRAGDILILLPRREPFGSEIIRHLKMLNVPVAGADRIRLTEHIAVMDLIAMGRFALLPEDDLTLATILRSPLIALSEEELFSLCHGRDGTLWHSLSAHRNDAPFAQAHAFLAKMLARADYAPPYEFYAQMLIADGGRTKMLSRLGAEAADAIDEFLSLALSYEALNMPSLEGFLHWIERGAAEIRRDMERGRDEVRVMTVHGAKGLEADIVILPDTTRPPGGAAGKGNLLYTDDSVLFPLSDAEAPASVKAAKQRAKEEALKEHRRLLYVALTRAKDRLYICGFENKRGVDGQSWYALAEQAAKSIGAPIERDNETIHVLGSDEETQADKLAVSVPVTREIPQWARSMPREETQLRMLRPSDAEPEIERTSPIADRNAIGRGLLIHTMLARLPEVEASARNAIAMKFLNARGIDANDAELLARETLHVLDDPVFAAAFAPGSRAEVPLVAELPELNARINGRIDRLAITDGTVLIVDFKTNRAPPERENGLPAAYVTQMALYRAALNKIFPGMKIICGLVWTDGPRLTQLSDALLDTRLLRMKG